MKRKLLIIVLNLFIVGGLSAQEWRINGHTFYVFDDKVDSYYSGTSYYEGTIKGGFMWGVGLEYMLHPTYGIGLNYFRQDTKVPMRYYDNGDKNREFDLAANWFMLGGTRYMQKGKAELYGGFELGAVFYEVSNSLSGKSASATKFGWGIKLGSNIFFNERVGIKLQADMRSAAQGAGGGMYFGTGGVGAGVSTYSSIYQFGLGGGLVFRFPPKTAAK